MLFLMPYQQCQSTEGMSADSMTNSSTTESQNSGSTNNSTHTFERHTVRWLTHQTWHWKAVNISISVHHIVHLKLLITIWINLMTTDSYVAPALLWTFLTCRVRFVRSVNTAWQIVHLWRYLDESFEETCGRFDAVFGSLRVVPAQLY